MTEAHQWLSEPGEKRLVTTALGHESLGKDLVKALYEAGASLVEVYNPRKLRSGLEVADTILVRSAPEVEGDVLIAISRFKPFEIERTKKDQDSHEFLAVWIT